MWYNFSLKISVYYSKEDTNQKQRYWGQGLGGSQMSSPCGVGTHHPPGTVMHDNMLRIGSEGSSPELWCPEFPWFHCEGVSKWIMGHLIELNLQLPLPSPEVGLIPCDSKPQPSNHLLVFLSWSGHHLSHLLSINSQGPPRMTKTFLWPGKFQVFKCYQPGTGDRPAHFFIT